MITITRKLEFDAGHRIPHHQGHCRNLHGHRYVLEITLAGSVLHHDGASDDGMLLDFGDVKTLAMQHLVSLWDHAFLVYKGDAKVMPFLADWVDHKTVVLDVVPTVENLAQIAFALLQPVFAEKFGRHLHLHKVVLFETPNCWAEVFAPAKLHKD